jgi:hypothetical protein
MMISTLHSSQGKYTYEGKDHQHVSLYRIFNRFTIPRICQASALFTSDLHVASEPLPQHADRLHDLQPNP